LWFSYWYFKAGFGIGAFTVIAVVVVIIWLVSNSQKIKNRNHK
jgi:hypothetical protein